MSNPGNLSAIEVEAEISLGETSPNTYATFRVPLIGAVDTSGLVHAKIDSERAVQYRNDGTPHIPGTMGGQIKTRTYLVGHGSSTLGATTISAYETWLGNVIGNATLSATSGTTASGGTASALTTAASGTFAPGSLTRVGVLGDGRCNGQVAAVATHATNTLNLLTALAAAPSGTDPVSSGVNLYPSENPTATTVTSYRMRLLTANLRYECHGCVPTAYTITGTNPGEIPVIEITWNVAWWAHSTGAFPSTVATESANPAPVAAGSLFINDVGIATRNTLVCRSFSLDVTMGMEVQKGSGGYHQYQDTVSARRLPDRFKIRVLVDADANTASPILDAYWTGTASKHVLYTLSTSNGSTVAFYFPKCCVTGARPVQKIDANVNRYEIELTAYTGGTTTSDMTLSAFRMLCA